MSEAADLHTTFSSVSTAYRLQHSGVMIDGVVPLDFGAYPYIPEIIDEHARRVTILKGAQMGFTVAAIMRALEEAKSNRFRGIGYFFPTEGEVSDFAKARFGPMMTNNPAIWGDIVKDTDSASLKRINDTFLYFRGMGQKGSGAARRSTSKLKSIPLDRLYLDERDEMDDARVDAAEHRLDGSLDPEIFVLSTPTLPAYGVDFDYRSSNQSVWMWRCDRCSQWTCLELTYPECIADPFEGEPHYLCHKCRDPLARTVGEWVAREQGVTDHLGYWVSQLSSPTKSAADILRASEVAAQTGRRSEFENQTLARAYAEVDQEITAQQLMELINPDERKMLHHSGPCAMGVDPGKPHWWEVRSRVTSKDSQQVARGRADSYEELGQIAKRYNVESGVMDQGYDPTSVQKFVADHPGWWGCLYVTAKKTAPDWDFKKRVVRVGRDWALDASHAEIINKHLILPAKDESWDDYVSQMTNLKRAVVEKADTGERKGVWVVTGSQKYDHMRHAGGYAMLAAGKVGLARETQAMIRDYRQKENKRKRPRSAMVL